MTIAPPDNSPVKPARPAMPPWLGVVGLIAVLTVMRMVYAGVMELRTDEAYYWTWSKESALSFLDHPPGIAWMIRFGTAIFGDTSLGVRFSGIVAMLVTQLLLADIVRRVTRDFRAVVFAVLLPEAALYYGLLMAKVAPDTAMIPFATAMLWALVRLHESDNPRWWLAAGLFAGLALLSKFTAVMLAPAVLAFALVPDWRRRWLLSPYPWLAALIAVVVFLPVLIWNAQHDWASFRFQFVRAVADHELSFRTVGDFIGLQFGLVGFVLLPVVLSGVTLTAWRGYRSREPVAILLSTAVLVPFLYFFWKSLTLRVGDTWPMFLWPAGFAATAINLFMLSREGWPDWMVKSSFAWAKVAVISGIAFVVAVFLYYVAAPWNFIGRADPVGGEAGYERVVERARDQLQKTGATWIATTDYRTYAMLRWYFNGSGVPVVQINERGRFQDFRDPGMAVIKDHTGLYVGREPDNRLPLWNLTTAKRQTLERVERGWRGVVMDTYALEKITGWTPDLSPPPDSPLFRWRVLAGTVEVDGATS
ncbi:Dolichyl-phosphate-mannose-protein mannosyltransferase [Bradyrhizobium lablabi]|uniref:Dolichyl-phosphate-mannose-protein mannosyltransferase n=3 Tax=Nitrobacteraceae TaxID=41294 RepID=A0ABY0PZH8_9BRAD|nr:Dolichyl-phosphate-mannose-protein mannosyltransferase [Bradyrhizobium ottawaense]SEC80371.1 Dolichyl-phosphate-mannose-protein mannosyltransferase [Bradyrhizobium lablabi]SHK91384.1 Dolichyl-phosphate-mannose-protein mannosyltransferase [Bradyrhizobium lablabi]